MTITAQILVTGVNGQVGSAILSLKENYPFELIPISRTDWDMAKEPTKAASLIEQHQPIMVINPAAYTNVVDAEDDQRTAFTVNAIAVGELAKACKRTNIPLLHVSTDYVFDGAKRSPYTEDDPINPINVYGKSKAEGELLIRKEIDEHIILRTSWVFSKTGKNFVTTMRRLAKERDEVKVVDDQRGSPTSANCIAKILLSIASKYLQGDATPWGTYHYTGSPAVSWYEFAETIFRTLNENNKPRLIPCSSTQFPTRAARPKNSTLQLDKFEAAFGDSICKWNYFL